MTEPTLPPIDPGDIDSDVKPPAWPKVIGIISIVIGGLFVTCGACGLVSLVRGPQAPPNMTAPPATPPLLAGLQVIGFLLSFLLLVAGILLTMRRKPGAILHLVYGLLGVPVGAVMFYAQFGYMELMKGWIAENPDLQKMQGVILAGFYVGMVVGFFFMMYDVFLVVWFGFIKRGADLGRRPVSTMI